jgi:spore coat polysaccharide biosynthesis protein SpsF
MQSTRLPGKVLALLGRRPLLEYVVTRLAALKQSQVLVATSTSAADDTIEHFCRVQGVAWMRGSEADVLGRYVAATADMADDDIVVRATADNPLYCPIRTAAIIAEHGKLGGDYTFITNLSYVVPEVVRVGALRAMAQLATSARSREHVTPYFRESEHSFRIHPLPEAWRGLRPEIRLTVDTPEELKQMAAICRAFDATAPLFPLDDVYEYLSGHGNRCREEFAA